MEGRNRLRVGEGGERERQRLRKKQVPYTVALVDGRDTLQMVAVGSAGTLSSMRSIQATIRGSRGQPPPGGCRSVTAAGSDGASCMERILV